MKKLKLELESQETMVQLFLWTFHLVQLVREDELWERQVAGRLVKRREMKSGVKENLEALVMRLAMMLAIALAEHEEIGMVTEIVMEIRTEIGTAIGTEIGTEIGRMVKLKVRR